MAATTDPLRDTHSASPPAPVSKQTVPIAGILTDIYGLKELPPTIHDVACLWLLHPRLGTKERMDQIAAATIREWNKRLQDGRGGPHPKALIAVSFDQRNHGTREVDSLSNQAWRDGNPRHAQDMFSAYHGTAQDTSFLITYLPAYAFPDADHRISSHLALGVSLGGHAAWLCALHDARITAAVVGIGCPDFTSLMRQRAEKSKRQTWTSTDPPGVRFFGSRDFPPALMDAVRRWDPAGCLLDGHAVADVAAAAAAPGSDVRAGFGRRVRQHLGGKRVLLLSGGADKLVPYACGEPFLALLKEAVREEKSIAFEDVVYDGVGHAFTAAMAEKAVAWVCDVLQSEGQTPAARLGESKI